MAATALAVVAATSAPAHADPPCARFGVCQYMPSPYNNGPLMPTWDIPGNYRVGQSPSMCDPKAYRCYPAMPGSGF